MKIDIQLGIEPGEGKVTIDGKDVSNRLTEISINKSVSTIPEVTMKFVPDECNINVDTHFIIRDKEFGQYSLEELSKEIIKKITNGIGKCKI